MINYEKEEDKRVNESIVNGSVTIVADRMFCSVMRNPAICRELVERILGCSIGPISYPEKQKSIANFLRDKDSRLDIYFEDDINTKYDLEMQRKDTGNLPKRTRYYHYKIDGNSLKMGDHYKELSSSYIIFLCAFDLFGAGLPVYTFQASCKEKPEILLGDGQTTIFVNLTATDFSAIDTRLANVIRYVQNKEVTDDFTKSIDNMVENVNKVDREVGSPMLTAEQKLAEEKQAIGEQSRREGRREGISQGVLGLHGAGWDNAQIATQMNISVKMVEEILSD